MSKLNLSPHTLRLWLGCPYAYALDKIVKVPRYRRVIAPAMHTGRAVHTVLEQLVRQPLLSLEEAERTLERTFSWGAYASRKEAEAAYQLAHERLCDWVRSPYGWGEGTSLAVEKMLRSGAGEALVLWGRPDLVRIHPEGFLEVVDHKSGRHIPTADQLKQDPQAGIYRILGELHWPGYPGYQVSFSYLATGAVVPVRYTPEEIEVWWDLLFESARHIQRARAQTEGDIPLEEAFEPRPGEQCLYCSFRKVCAFSIE